MVKVFGRSRKKRDANGSATVPSQIGGRYLDKAVSRLTPYHSRSLINTIKTISFGYLFNMYAGWNLVLTLVMSLLFSRTSAFWPFSSLVSAESGGVNNAYDPTAKRIAIIGTSYYSEYLCPIIWMRGICD